MPTYEYQCRKCGHRFERFQRMTDAPVRQCEKCRGRVERLISGGSGIIFKGSGFYITDYARKGPKPTDGPPKRDESAKREEPAGKAETEKKTDSKPDKSAD